MNPVKSASWKKQIYHLSSVHSVKIYLSLSFALSTSVISRIQGPPFIKKDHLNAEKGEENMNRRFLNNMIFPETMLV